MLDRIEAADPDAVTALIITAQLMAILGLIWAVEAWRKRPRKNSRRPGVLPPPSPACQRFPDWRVHASHEGRR